MPEVKSRILCCLKARVHHLKYMKDRTVFLCTWQASLINSGTPNIFWSCLNVTFPSNSSPKSHGEQMIQFRYKNQ